MKKSSSVNRRLVRFAFPACASLSLFASSLLASPVPPNLGNGLGKLVESNLVLKGEIEIVDGEIRMLDTNAKARSRQERRRGEFNGFATQEAASFAALSLSANNPDRPLVRITLNGRVEIDALIKQLGEKFASFTATSIDRVYRGVGVMNAYVGIDDVPALASAPGVQAVHLELKPRNSRAATATAPVRPAPSVTPGQNIPNLGTYVDQGIFQHRLDLTSFYNANPALDTRGAGMSIACISNSFNANTANPASIDVTNNDLPGNASNPAGNTTPVFVLLDDLSSTTSDDEGRGMCQIVYKMMPKAKVGFSTADTGEVGFANAIRGLAGINSSDFPNASSNAFKADVICDDVGYFDEPFYQDGIIGAGIEDVAAAGVSYFSSAANDVGVNGYESVIRLVPPGTGLTAAAGNTSLAGTNINLANVPTNLYAGGFHNFNPNGLDVAQTVNVAANNTVATVLQWNDPYDQAIPITIGAQIFSASGTITSATPVTFNGTSTPPLPLFVAGQGYQIVETATSGTLDGIITVINPDGTTLLTQDTGADETVTFHAPVSGQYQIRVSRFGTTTGNFNLTVNLATFQQNVNSDWNLLAFRTDTGAYVAASSLVSNNVASNIPVEIGFVNRTSATVTSIQYVLARSNTPPAGARVADRIRYLLPGNGLGGYGPAEYFTYNTVTTAGHATSPSCNGVAAYAAFRPNIPESFTSPGPAIIYFDRNSNLLPTPQIRFKPTIAALDGGNISANEGLAGLGTDDTGDYDAAANFYGTSAASPHAAAIGLLVLQKNRVGQGPTRSLTPAQVTSILTRSTFPHDLDPNFSSGTARTTGGGKVTVTIASDTSANGGAAANAPNVASGGTGRNDNNAFGISYVGPSSIATFVFNPTGNNATGGAVTAGSNGLDPTNNYFSTLSPGVYFNNTSGTGSKAFVVGSGSTIATANVTAATSNPPTTLATAGKTLTLTFNGATFTGGNVLRFGIGRGIITNATVPTGTASGLSSADLFGGGVVIPEGTVINAGMAFSGTLADGSTFSGVISNRIGQGYSILDGFGFIDANAAVNAPVRGVCQRWLRCVIAPETAYSFLPLESVWVGVAGIWIV